MAEDNDSGAKPKQDKSDLVNEAWRLLKLPSYEAWQMTVADLKAALKGVEG